MKTIKFLNYSELDIDLKIIFCLLFKTFVSTQLWLHKVQLK